MFIMGYGISMDVEDLPFAVLDHDQTTPSQIYTLDLAGSRYFIEQPPIANYDELDRRRRSGELSLALMFPTTYVLAIARGALSKALGFADLGSSLLPLALAIPAIQALSVALLKKQES